MIKSITTSSPHLYSSGVGSFPYVSSNPGNPSQGMIRINGSDMEVFDGTVWMKVYMNNANIGLSSSANSAIDWAIERMEEEQEWQKLAESNKAVKIALDNLEEARRQLSITAELAREYEQTTS
jgi:dipeptidase